MSWRKRNVDSVPVLFSHGHLLSSLSLSLFSSSFVSMSKEKNDGEREEMK